MRTCTVYEALDSVVIPFIENDNLNNKINYHTENF